MQLCERESVYLRIYWTMEVCLLLPPPHSQSHLILWSHLQQRRIKQLAPVPAAGALGSLPLWCLTSGTLTPVAPRQRAAPPRPWARGASPPPQLHRDHRDSGERSCHDLHDSRHAHAHGPLPPGLWYGRRGWRRQAQCRSRSSQQEQQRCGKADQGQSGHEQWPQGDPGGQADLWARPAPQAGSPPRPSLPHPPRSPPAREGASPPGGAGPPGAAGAP
jgi:hypothetical protein